MGSSLRCNDKIKKPMQIKIFKSPLPYAETHAKMEQLVADIISGKEEEQIWFLESEPVYTAGTSARPEDVISDEFPVVTVGRGGKHTYHGPGQRVIYLMLELKKHYPTPDIKKFVSDLENWVIDSLAELGIKAFRREGRVGIWVNAPTLPTPHPNPLPQGAREPSGEASAITPSPLRGEGWSEGEAAEAKIAAIGIRVRKGISFHGISININPNLAHFNGIVPCGIAEFGVTSLHAMNHKLSMSAFDEILIKHCPFLKA